MAKPRRNAVLEHIRNLLVEVDAGSLPDRDLLRRFTGQQDEVAFKAILRRHGPMVLRVCQRVLDRQEDVEDAFQATFLVLARRAGTLADPDALSSWLYGVAHRLAREARRRNFRQKAREARSRARSIGDPLEDITGRELVAILDEELAALPERYRAPLLLCCMEGKSGDQAARQLRCSLSTLKRRLQQARELLRGQLHRRGVGLSATALTALLVHQSAAAPVPLALSAATARAALLLTAGQPWTSVASAGAAVLAHGLTRSLCLAKLKAALVALVVIGGLASGTGVLLRQVRIAPPAVTAPPLELRSLAAAAEKRGLWPELSLSIQHESPILAFAWSPNGQWLASGTRDGTIHITDAASGQEMHTFATDSSVLSLAASPDGAMLALCHDRLGQTFSTWDIETGEQLQSGFFEDYRSEHIAVNPDGSAVVGASYGEFVHWRLSGPFYGTRARVTFPGGTAAISADGRVSAWADSDGLVHLCEHEPVIRTTRLPIGEALCVALGPTGKLLAVSRSDHAIQLWDWAAGQATTRLVGLGRPAMRLAFAADGRSLAALGDDGATIAIWDLDTHHIDRWLQLPSLAKTLSFAPDGRRLATLGTDGKIRIWNNPPPLNRDAERSTAHPLRRG